MGVWFVKALDLRAPLALDEGCGETEAVFEAVKGVEGTGELGCQ